MSLLSRWINSLKIGTCGVCGRHYTPADVQCGMVLLIVDPLEGVVIGVHLEHFHGSSRADKTIGSSIASCVRNWLRALRDKNPAAPTDVHGFPARSTKDYRGTVDATE